MTGPVGPHTRQLLEGYDFALDGFQRRAADALDAGRSVLVSAPTGAGKTVVADYAVAQAMDRGLRAFYTEEQFKAGRKVVVVCNLKPAKMAGFESAGMVLCAANAEHTKVHYFTTLLYYSSTRRG